MITFIICAVVFAVSMVGMYITKDKQKSVLQNGDRIRITYLPPCRNGNGSPNPYIGMEGEVQDLNSVDFTLFTGSSFLVFINLKTCKFVKM
jgi:hypothetical protein